MSMMGVFFCAVNTPFKLWLYHINVNFGFTNVLSMSQSMMLDSVFQSVVHLLITGIPSFMVYLLLLSHRWGWLMMYTGILSVSVFVQYNVGTLGPSIFGASAIFPGNDFGVGDGFPLGGDAHNVSLNRIFYPVDNSSGKTFRTSDFSSGQLKLEPVDGKKRRTPWQVTETGAGGGQLAVTTGEILSQKGGANLDRIEEQEWSFDNGDSAESAHIGVRRGKRLRDELFGFAEERNIHVKEVYMIDGSHADTRANAFAAGAGRDRIIGLYDTLFLGSTADDSAVDDTTGSLNAGELFSVGSLGSRLRGVDRSEGEMRRKRRSTPVQAMTDIEILAVMGHELGHTALHHSEGGMGVEAVTSFLTFAVLGWAVHCPALAASVGFAAPVVHIGVFLYNRIISPPLDISVGILTSAISRANENAADAYSARVSEDYAEGLQTALGKLTINSNNDPNEPWYYEVLHDDHPTTAKRWANVNRIRRKLYGGERKSTRKHGE
jgi:Zn-dependent protease with chaperone function